MSDAEPEAAPVSPQGPGAGPRAEPADPWAGRTVGVLGGTGPQGRGLARRWARAGVKVVIGSRDEAGARRAAQEVVDGSGGDVVGASNAEAAAVADVVVITVPWAAHAMLLTELAPQLRGKIVVDCVNPLGFDEHGPFALPVEEGSATEQAAALLPDSTVVGAFHSVSAVLLGDDDFESLATDVLVLGDDREATDLIQALASKVPGMRGIFGGRLRNAHQVEALTANLISINRRYKAHVGVRMTDI